MPTIEETLQSFLFNKVKEDTGYLSFCEGDVPTYISDNLAKSKVLRKYQEEAVKRFIYCIGECVERPERDHLLFNMATGSGKTLVMAAAILHLYEKGYRNFVFLVHNKNILTQAINVFTNSAHEKYLFNRKVSFNGRAIEVRQVTDFENANDTDINMMFMTTQLFFNRMNNAAEDVLQKSDFEDRRTVIIADEAHRLNVNTRKKTDVEDKNNWEQAVAEVLRLRDDTMLLEFTATVDLKNPYINEKYKDKLLYKYDFAEFNRDGYSKQVRFLFNKEAKVADQKRLLIVNAIALSQFRKMLFEDLGYEYINPVILVKSKKIADSEKDKEFFHEVIDTLRADDFRFLKDVQNDEEGIVTPLFGYLDSKKISVSAFIQNIRAAFSERSAIIYNSKHQQNAALLKDLDEKNPRNIIRVVFSVNALNEGWDVLSLYDIVHFDISEEKRVTQQDIQLIGRGARYCPFLLKGDEGSLFGMYGNEAGKRKFDEIGVGADNRKILDSFYYHFVETQTFLDGLLKNLKNEGILDKEMEKVSIKMKDVFMNSDTYRKGFVLVNGVGKRPKTTEDEKERVFGEVLSIKSYELQARGLTDAEEARDAEGVRIGDMDIIKDFNRDIIKKSLMRAENGFFRFSNLIEHITYLQSIDQFIDEGLGEYTIKYEYQKGKDIPNLSVEEKLQLLIGEILPEVRKIVDRELPKKSAGKEFRPVSLRTIFEKEKSVYVRSSPEINERTGKVEYDSSNERTRPQTGNNDPELQLDIANLEWYAYNENYGTSEEKRFVRYIDSQIESLFEAFKGAEIFLVRNELDYWIYGEGGKRFAPDYLLFINDTKGKKFYYQCIFEPKGKQLLEKDKWKERTLEELEKMTKISFETKDGDKKTYTKYLEEVKNMGYTVIKNMGFAFYNSEDEEQLTKFKEQFQRVYDR